MLSRSSWFIVAAAIFASAPTSGNPLGNPAGLAPDTPGVNAAKPSATHANVQDKLFVRQASLGGRAELELSRIAQSKGSDDGVKNFAARMIKDHNSANERLVRAGRGVNVEIPEGLEPEHQSIQRELNTLQGKDFDIAYLSSQVREHQKTANLLQWHMSYGQSQPLVKYSTDTLPAVMEHLEMAKHEYARLTSGKMSASSDQRQ